ncbi:MAG: hypothetical protein Q7R55_00705 [Candidatus Wildermuthbacteria bacterium]|nr:hypothetical protein [Candidatus Wildermuthbacteria bacterium]
MERQLRQQELNRREKEREREAVQECRKGNFGGFRSYIYPKGEIKAGQILGVSPEEFQEWERLTTQ